AARAWLSSRDVAPNGVVLRLRMMDDERRSALLWHELERAGECHSELALGGKNLEELSVGLEVGTRAVTPRVAFALPGRHAEFMPQLARQPLGNRFGGFDGEAVDVERLGVFVARLKRLKVLRRDVADGHDLERNDVDVGRIRRSEIIGDTQSL